MEVSLELDMLVKPQDIIDVSGLSCEDCPETNPNPPDTSDCENFDSTVCPVVCTREDSLGKQVMGFLTRQQ
jgi:hypothetical protein